MRLAIVTTTINKPTKALKKFIDIAAKRGYKLYIVGDKKTPHEDYQELESKHEFIKYLTPEHQVLISKELSDLIGWNCIQRRNFGLIQAYNDGADVIATVDDDNIPYDFWGSNCIVGKEISLSIFNCANEVFDPLAIHGIPFWHRGYPIQELQNRRLKSQVTGKRTILVQADLWDGDPDVDAVCRIAYGPEMKFNPMIMPYTADKPMPFNSQNTFISRQLFPDYFLFPHIGRMDDIWAAYYVQSKFPSSVAFSRASVNQERNEHDLAVDLQAEMIGYKHTKDFIEWLESDEKDTLAWPEFVPQESIEAFKVYRTLFKV